MCTSEMRIDRLEDALKKISDLPTSPCAKCKGTGKVLDEITGKICPCCAGMGKMVSAVSIAIALVALHGYLSEEPL